jgi:hypothetical protein
MCDQVRASSELLASASISPATGRSGQNGFVERENNLSCVLAVSQDRSITGVRRPIDDAFDVVASFGERRCH